MLIEGLSWGRIREAVRRGTCGPLGLLHFCHLSSLAIEKSSISLHSNESNAALKGAGAPNYLTIYS